MEVRELDVVGVVEAGVIDKAVDGIERYARASLFTLGLQAHPVGLKDADHSSDLVGVELLHAARVAN